MKPKYLILIVSIVIIAALCFVVKSSMNTKSATVSESDSVYSNSPSYSLRGLVKDGMSHKGLVATVTLTSSEHDVKTMSSGDNGSYHFDINREEYRISAALDGYVARGMNDLSYEVFLDDENDNTDVVQDIELWPESKIIGRIVNDNTGFPADIRLAYQIDASGAENYDFKSITTSDDGEFAFDMAYAGTAKLVITANGFPEQTLSDIVLEPGKTVDLRDIPLLHGVSLSGTVFNSKTQIPITNAKVQIIENNNIVYEVTSDKNGAYQFPELMGTNILLKTVAEGYKNIDSTISLAGVKEQNFDVYLIPVEGISLTINNITGREPVQSTVTVTDIATEKVIYQKELENGSYELTELTDGPYQFTAVSADGETTAIARATGGNAVTLTLKPYGKISVKFNLDGADAQFKEGKYQYTYDSDDGQNVIKGWFETKTESFTIDNLKPGTYTLEAQVVLDSEQYKSIKLSAKPVHLNMGDTEYVELTLNNSNNKALCTFPDNGSASDMSNAISECYARIDAAKQKFDDYMDADFFSDHPDTELQNIIETANEMAQEFIPAYSDIISHSSNFDTAGAAIYQIGSTYEKIGQLVMSAPVPKELPPEVEEQYRGVLKAYASKYYEKASDFYEKVISKGAEANIKNEYTSQASERIAALKLGN